MAVMVSEARQEAKAWSIDQHSDWSTTAPLRPHPRASNNAMGWLDGWVGGRSKPAEEQEACGAGLWEDVR